MICPVAPSHKPAKPLLYVAAAVAAAVIFTILCLTPSSARGPAPYSGIKVLVPEHVGIPGPDSISYAVSETESSSPHRLVLDCTLPQTQEENYLNQLAYVLYVKNNGSDYNQVIIKWLLDKKPEDNQLWALSILTPNSETIGMIRSAAEESE